MRNTYHYRFSKWKISLIKFRLFFFLGEPFNAEEMNEMLQTCLAFADQESSGDNPHILYKYYINELVVEDTKD